LGFAGSAEAIEQLASQHYRAFIERERIEVCLSTASESDRTVSEALTSNGAARSRVRSLCSTNTQADLLRALSQRGEQLGRMQPLAGTQYRN